MLAVSPQAAFIENVAYAAESSEIIEEQDEVDSLGVSEDAANEETDSDDVDASREDSLEANFDEEDSAEETDTSDDYSGNVSENDVDEDIAEEADSSVSDNAVSIGDEVNDSISEDEIDDLGAEEDTEELAEFMDDAVVASLGESSSSAITARAGYYAKSGLTTNARLNQSSIASRYLSYYNNHMDLLNKSYYAETPSAAGTFVEGKVTSEYLNDTLELVNIVRQLAGLGSVSIDSGLVSSAQKAALISAANKVISHGPKCPSGMSSALYSAASTACASSNLYGLSGGTKANVLLRSIASYMDDNNSPDNRKAVGHRRWVLYPFLTKTGFGYANNGTYSGSAMKVTKGAECAVNPSNTAQSLDYDFVSWPSSGNFPVDEYYSYTNFAKKNVPWSISLNPSKYSAANVASVKVTVTRDDGKKWIFSNATTPYSSSCDKTSQYITVNNNGYGTANCIIFNFGNAYADEKYNFSANNSNEALYTIKVEGIKTISGSPTVLTYQTNFFNVRDIDTESPYYDGAKFNEAIPSSGSGGSSGGNNENEEQDPNPQEEEETLADLEAFDSEKMTVTFLKGSSYEYTGNVIIPKVKVEYDGQNLVEGKHYKLVGNSKNAGTGYFDIVGIPSGGYSATSPITKSFTITPRDISNVHIWFEPIKGKKTFTSAMLKGHLQDNYGPIDRQDYKIVFPASALKLKKVTTYNFTIEGRGNYKGTANTSVLIYKAKKQKLLCDAMVKAQKKGKVLATNGYNAAKGGYTYTGAPIKPAVNKKILKKAGIKKYSVSYENNVAPGYGRVVIKGKGEYKKQTYYLYFKIVK